MSLEIAGVEKWFDGTRKTPVQHVLRGVHLSIETGEFVSLIGHSGCGKSTLLNVVAGLLSPILNKFSFDPLIARMHKP